MNKTKSNLIIKSMIACFSLFGVIFAICTYIVWKYNLSIWIGFGIAISISLIQFVCNPYIIEIMYKIKFKDETEFLTDEIISFIDQISKDVNIKRPKIGIIEDGNPNAFTYGHGPFNARVILTRGIIDLLDENELKSVIAHEIAHIKNYDFITMTIVSLIPSLAYMLYIKTRSNKNNIGFAVSLGAYLTYLLSGFATLAFSRVREYYADSFASDYMNDYRYIKSALIKISYGVQSIKTEDRLKDSCIAFSGGATNQGFLLSTYNKEKEDKLELSLMKWDFNNLWAKWYEINSTHPLTAKRIAFIQGNLDLKESISLNAVFSFLSDFIIRYLHYILSGFIVLNIIIPNKNFEFGRLTEAFLSIFKMGFDMPFISISFGVCILLKTFYKWPIGYKESTINQLLSNENVSPYRGIPVILKGKIIGRGVPGYFLSEDLVIDDNTGIMLLDYEQPIPGMELSFAIFDSDEMKEKEVCVKGWYKRNTRPYIEVKNICVEDKDIASLNKPFSILIASVIIAFGLLLVL